MLSTLPTEQSANIPPQKSLSELAGELVEVLSRHIGRCNGTAADLDDAAHALHIASTIRRTLVRESVSIAKDQRA